MRGLEKRLRRRRACAAAGAIKAALGGRTIVLVGLMGCGKSSVGRRLAVQLGMTFVDADEEIERAAGHSIPEIFAKYGEEHFRDREAKVIFRILESGPQVLATGGGAFMRADTRDSIRDRGISVWLKADLPVLMQRVSRRSDRPLLRTADPEATMRGLMAERYPVYAEADITIESRDVSHDVIVSEIVEALQARLVEARPSQPAGRVRRYRRRGA
ncbi:MAG: shikimate kinase [Hyphomicrobiaceae bacterium]|nr:shikimate kinase [Hyphomicrobiaceae bacterium]